jgi:hypothetical protein
MAGGVRPLVPCGQDTRLGYFQQDLNVLAQIWQDGTNEFYANARVGVELFDSRPPTSRTRVSTASM